MPELTKEEVLKAQRAAKKRKMPTMLTQEQLGGGSPAGIPAAATLGQKEGRGDFDARAIGVDLVTGATKPARDESEFKRVKIEEPEVSQVAATTSPLVAEAQQAEQKAAIERQASEQAEAGAPAPAPQPVPDPAPVQAEEEVKQEEPKVQQTVQPVVPPQAQAQPPPGPPDPPGPSPGPPDPIPAKKLSRREDVQADLTRLDLSMQKMKQSREMGALKSRQLQQQLREQTAKHDKERPEMERQLEEAKKKRSRDRDDDLLRSLSQERTVKEQKMQEDLRKQIREEQKKRHQEDMEARRLYITGRKDRNPVNPLVDPGKTEILRRDDPKKKKLGIDPPPPGPGDDDDPVAAAGGAAVDHHHREVCQRSRLRSHRNHRSRHLPSRSTSP